MSENFGSKQYSMETIFQIHSKHVRSFRSFRSFLYKENLIHNQYHQYRPGDPSHDDNVEDLHECEKTWFQEIKTQKE